MPTAMFVGEALVFNVVDCNSVVICWLNEILFSAEVSFRMFWLALRFRYCSETIISRESQRVRSGFGVGGLQSSAGGASCGDEGIEGV